MNHSLPANIRNNFFTITKLCSMILLLSYFIITEQGNTVHIGMELFILSCLLSVSVFYELTVKSKIPFLLLEAGLLLILLFAYGNFCILWLPIVILDFLAFFHAAAFFYFIPVLGVLYYRDHSFLYIVFCLFCAFFYLQNHFIIKEYREFLGILEEKENRLKTSLDHKDILLRKELEQNSLHFENKILEEKALLSQALHDKLGHSVNGSIYQLEACRILAAKEPEESLQIIERVITTLRESMDEIRMMLRNEKPNKKRMALLQLEKLCEDCREKYGIEARVSLEDELSLSPALIPETIWEVILDNTFEAVSNALKYAHCQNILIQITILNKFVRCYITDDGVGCEQINEGMGIQGMKHRTRKIGGVLSAESVSGFSINMILPYHMQNQKEFPNGEN